MESSLDREKMALGSPLGSGDRGRAFVDLCLALLAVDRTISPPEIVALNSLIDRLWEGGAAGPLHAYAEERISAPASVYKACAALNAVLGEIGEGARELVFMECASLLTIDGLTPGEEAELRTLGSSLRVGEDIQTTLVSMIHGELETLEPRRDVLVVGGHPRSDLLLSGEGGETPSALCLCAEVGPFLVLYDPSGRGGFVLDGISLASRRFHVLGRDSELAQGAFAIAAEGLRAFLCQKADTDTESLGFDARDGRLVPARDPDRPDLRVSLRGTRVLVQRRRDAAVAVRLEPRLEESCLGEGEDEAATLLSASDWVCEGSSSLLGRLELDSAPAVVLAAYAAPALAEALKFRAAEGGGPLRLTNDPSARGIYIREALGEALELEITSLKGPGGWDFRLRALRLPLKTLLGDRELAEGEEARVEEGARLSIGNSAVFFDRASGEVRARELRIETLEAAELGFRFPDGRIGVDRLTFSARAGEMVALMGGSGAGKSTLLKLLIGINRPSSGAVLVDGRDLHEGYESLVALIGYVPQDDLLIDSLTVYENLLYSAEIRFPRADRSALDAAIDRALAAVSLTERKRSPVGSPLRAYLSGGQRKRLNIATELLGEPDLFFLDEPTSGLSSNDSENLMRRLRTLTNRGAITFVVIHQPSSEVFKLFDKVLVLDTGGKLAFFGPPARAVGYFLAADAAAEGAPAAELGRGSSAACPSCGNLNAERIFQVMEKSGRERRRTSAEEWQRRFAMIRKAEGGEAGRGETASRLDLPAAPPRKGLAFRARTTWTLCRRNLREKLKDPMQLALVFLAPLLLGLLMGALLRGGEIPYAFYRNEDYPKYLFLSVIIAIFMGLMASIGEVVKDRPILMRERLLDIRPFQYLSAKLSSFLALHAVQVILYLASGFVLLGIPWAAPETLSALKAPNLFLYMVMLCMLVGTASFCLGLLVSAHLKTQAAAFAMIPLLIVPQIIFGGLFVPFSNMPRLRHESVPFYASFLYSRWGYEALLVASEELNPLFRATDPDLRLALRRRMEERGEAWDEQALVHRPLEDLRRMPAGSSPPREIGFGLFDGELAEAARAGGSGQRLAAMYERDEARALAILGDRSEEAAAYFRELADSVRPFGLFNPYLEASPNRAVHDELARARSSDWSRRLRGEGREGLAEWLADTNVFPARMKIWGSMRIPTIRFIPFVLLLHIALGCVLFLASMRREGA